MGTETVHVNHHLCLASSLMGGSVFDEVGIMVIVGDLGEIQPEALCFRLVVTVACLVAGGERLGVGFGPGLLNDRRWHRGAEGTALWRTCGRCAIGGCHFGCAHRPASVCRG